jgi:hypothetical protein
MKTKTHSTEKSGLISRIAQLEESVELISETLYDLISTLKNLPDPPCPPMCGSDALVAKRPRKKRKS